MSIETFLYELAKSNPKKITILCDSGDQAQLERLSKYTKTIKYSSGKKYRCKKAFFNFNLDAIDDIEAEEYTLVVHGNYEWLKSPLPIHDKITQVIAVSNDSARAYERLYKQRTGKDIKVKTVYNPINCEPKKTLLLMSATRLEEKTDNVKGKGMIRELGNHLNRYCQEHGYNYKWLIFTTDKDAIDNPNIIYCKPSLDVRDIMPKVDYVIQLSKEFEGYNYTVNESLTMGTPVVITRCPVYNELKITEDTAIYLDYDLSNIEEVMDRMYNDSFNFEYRSPESNWKDILAEDEIEVTDMKRIKVKATKAYKELQVMDAGLERIPEENEEFTVIEARVPVLLGDNPYHTKFIEVLEEIEEEDKPKKKRTKKGN